MARIDLTCIWAGLPASTGAATDSGVTGASTSLRSLGRDERREVTACVIRSENEGTQFRIADDADGAGIHGDALELVEVDPEGIGDDRLDDVAVAHCNVDCLLAKSSIPVSDRADSAVLHLCERLSPRPGEHGGTGMRLHDAPHRFLRQFLERPAGPVAIVALAEAFIGVSFDGATLSGCDDISGLLRSLKWGSHHGRKIYDRDARSDGISLRFPVLVEEHARGPAGEDTVGIRFRATVPDEDEGSHGVERTGHAITWLALHLIRLSRPSVTQGWVQHNGLMIRGMGLYGADSALALQDVRSWEMPGDSPVAPKLLDLKEQCKAKPGSFVWLGLFEPTKAELATVANVFELSPLQVEDAANDAQRPKVEVGPGGRIFVIAKVLDYIERSSDVQTGQLAVFIGPWFAVTVRFGQIGDLRGIRERLEDSADLRAHGSIAVLYSVLDRIVDGYLTVTDEIAQDIEDVETEVFSGIPSDNNANRIYRLKRENVEIRRAVSPLVPFAQSWVTDSTTWIPDDMVPYFRDIGEHMLRASDSTDSSDNLLMTMLMVSTSLQDLQQNRDMRKISSWVAIAAVPTMIAGIYGMNFDYMPELHQPWGYPTILLVMGTACSALYRAFKRSGWL